MPKKTFCDSGSNACANAHANKNATSTSTGFNNRLFTSAKSKALPEYFEVPQMNKDACLRVCKGWQMGGGSLELQGLLAVVVVLKEDIV